MKKKRYMTKLFSLLLSVSMIFTLMPGAVYAEPTGQVITAYLHISIDGELARVDKEGVDKDKFMAWRSVAVSDKTADDKITVEDMLICAHEQYRQDGTADLDISNKKVWGSDLAKLNLYCGSEVKKADKDTVIEAEEHITISGSTVAGREYRYCNFEHAGESISFSKDGIEEEDIYLSMLIGSAESEDEFSLSPLTAEYDVIVAEYDGKTLNTADSENCEIAEDYIDFKLKSCEGKYIVSLRKKGGDLYFDAPAVILNIQSNSVQANFKIMGYDPDKAEGIQTLREKKLDVWYDGKLAAPRGYTSMGSTVEAALTAAGITAEFSGDGATLNGVTWDRGTQDTTDDISLKNGGKTPRAMWAVVYNGQFQETLAKNIENNEEDRWLIYYTDDLAKELDFQFDSITAQAESTKKEGELTCIEPEFTPEVKEYTILYPEKSDRLTMVTVSENNENNVFRQIFFRDKKGEYTTKGRLLPADAVDDLRSISQYITANGYTDFKLVTCLRDLAGITFDEYRFDTKKLPLLNALTVEGNPIKQFDSLNRLSEFYISNQAKTIDIRPEAVRRDHIVTIDGKAADNGEVFKLNLSKLTFEDDKADIRITVKNNDTSVYGGETEYIVTLKREPATDVPTIMSKSLRSEGYALFEKPFKLKVHASASGKVSYQWYKGASEDKSEALPIIGEIGEELSPDTDKLGELYYFCRITNEGATENNVIDTETAKIEIYPDPTPENTKWTMEIPKLPEENAEMFGEHEYGYYYKQRDTNTDTLSVSAEWPVEEGVTKAYSWHKFSNTSTGVIGGANGSSYKINASTANLGEIYRCIPIARYRGKAYKGEPVDVYVYIEEQEADLSAVGNALWNGKGTAEEPWEISSREDLEKLRDSVDKKKYYAGHFFRLKNDIDLTKNWKPIGYGDTKSNGRNCKPFSGTFDGAGHTIRFEEGSLPLFGFVREATVKNLNIYAPYMAGYALVENYVVDYGEDGRYNLGTSGSYAPGTPDTITAINVTLKSGSVILKGGFMGGYASGGNTCVFSSCKVEDNVKIGWNKTENKPEEVHSSGSFGSEISGKFINCESAATVYGEDYVGGIVGSKGQTMGFFEIKNCRFTGEVIATGEYAGGIVGAGYYHESAPNTPCSTIENCYSNAKITASDYIGGILGGERACTQAWNLCYVRNNLFNGEIVATTPNAIKGGIIGHYNSLNKCNTILNNYYLTSVAENGIGFIKIVDTNADVKDKNNAIYCNTSERLPGIVGFDKRDYNRSDDPLGKDADKLTKSVTAQELNGNGIIKKLNDGEGSLKNWIKSDGKISHGEEPVACELAVKGRYKKKYIMGEPIDISKAIFIVSWSDGSETRPAYSEIEINGYNTNVRGVQTVELSYRGAKTEIKATVLKPEQPDQPNTIKVYFTLLGDEIHEVTDDNKHTLKAGNLETWITETEVEVNLNATVKTVFEKVLRENRFSWQNSSGNYVSHITTPKGLTLGEFTNGKLSGWMYTLNGTHPMLGLAEQFLENGDRIVWHYTDDYTKEEGSEKWNTGADAGAEVITAKDGNNEVTTVKTEVKKGSETASGGAVISTATVTVKDANAAEMIKQAKEMKSSEIVLNADSSEADADKVKVELTKSVAANIIADTKADLTVKLPEAEIKLNQSALKEISSQAKGDKLIIEVEKVKNPTDEQKKLAGKSAEVFMLTVKSGDTVIHSFGAGKVTVRKLIPDRLKDKKVAAIYIPEKGDIEVMSGKRVTIDKKNFYEFTTSHFSDFALVDADEAGIETSEAMTAEDVKAVVKGLKLKAATKALKKSIRVTVKADKETLMKLKESGCELKYNYYRAARKNGRYKLIATEKSNRYVDTKTAKGKTYYYKARLAVYDGEGRLIAATSLKNCNASKRQVKKAA